MSAPSIVTPGRDPWFDNGRWLAGSMVVMVHFTETVMVPGGLASWLHGALYPARIPLFALLVGYFTPRIPDARAYSNLIRQIVVPYFLVSAIHIGLNWWWDERPLFNPLATPYTLWFILSVIAWRLLVPVIMRFRYPLAMAVVLSLVTGALNSFWVFSFFRTFGLLPFVILGVYLRANDNWLRRRTGRTTLVAGGIIVAWILAVSVAKKLGLYDALVVGMFVPYESGLAGTASGALLRGALLIAVGAMSLAVLHLMPRRRLRWISYIGAGGFTIYLLHGLVLRLLRNWELLPTSIDHWWTVPSMVIASFALAAVLGSKPVRWLARPIVRPNLNWLLLPDTGPRPRTAPVPPASRTREEPAAGT